MIKKISVVKLILISQCNLNAKVNTIIRKTKLEENCKCFMFWECLFSFSCLFEQKYAAFQKSHVPHFEYYCFMVKKF